MKRYILYKICESQIIIIFQTQQISVQNKKFNLDWLTKFKQLAYLELEISIHCEPCVLIVSSDIGHGSTQSTN